jgi:hypothetical protein
MNKVHQFLYRGHDITIAKTGDNYTFGWAHGNRSVVSQFEFEELEDAIAGARAIMDKYVHLMNLVTIMEEV